MAIFEKSLLGNGVRVVTVSMPQVASVSCFVMLAAGSRYYLVYRNYEALLEYNCAHSYALSIALLADRIS